MIEYEFSLSCSSLVSSRPFRCARNSGKPSSFRPAPNVDHQLNEISAATDPAAKLKLIDAFSARIPGRPANSRRRAVC